MRIQGCDTRTRLHGVGRTAHVGRGAALMGLVLLFLFGNAPGFFQASFVSPSNLCEETDRSEENSDGERIASIQAQSVPSSGISRFIYPFKNPRLNRFGPTDQNSFLARELSHSLQPNPPPALSHFFA
jgi:hypothetical protein